jgi:hypothetical protein
MNINRWLLVVVIVVLLALPARAAVAHPASRPYHLGFTPFPYNVTLDAVTFTYEKIASDADLGSVDI